MIKKTILNDIQSQKTLFTAFQVANNHGSKEWTFKSKKACDQLLVFLKDVYEEKGWNLGFLLNEHFFEAVIKYKKQDFCHNLFVLQHYPYEHISMLSEEQLRVWLCMKIDTYLHSNSLSEIKKISNLSYKEHSLDKYVYYYVYMQRGINLGGDILDVNDLLVVSELHDFFYPCQNSSEMGDLVL